MLIGDILLFVAGRYMGWGLLGFLCKLSVNPETCILRSAESFYKRGKATLMFAKFIPGINTMAPPLAGSMNMRYGEFLGFDLAGALLYASAYLVVGFLFSDALGTITRSYDVFSRVLTWVVIAMVGAYLGFKAWLWVQSRGRP